jgi:hypothetical protein
MPWIRQPGVEGLVYVPELPPGATRKHHCPDCHACQNCSDARCGACRRLHAAARATRRKTRKT